MRYRPEIDGLRAIAVVPVVFFHAGFSGFSGGYIGVDIFFVISGYLITGLIMAEIEETGRFSIARFYERRARRILPALVVVTVVCTVAAALLFLPYRLIEFANNLIGVAAMISNVTLWRQGDYFSASAESNPLLHTWSLSVEEQFYLVFPLLLLLSVRIAKRRGALIFVLVASTLSLLFAEILLRMSTSAAFYLLPSRAWELGGGALAALIPSRPYRRGLGEFAAFVGAGLIAVAIIFFDETIPMPGRMAFIPVAGTVLTILFAQPGTYIARILSQRFVVSVGLISYSTYLWHQPLFAFARYRWPALEAGPMMVMLSLLSFGLGWLSYRFIEQPFRNRGFLVQRQVFALSVPALCVLGIAGAVLRLSDGFAERYPDYIRSMITQTFTERGAYVTEAWRKIAERPFDNSGMPRLMILGDSHSQDFYNMIRESGAFPNYQVSAAYVSAKCQVQFMGDRAHIFQDQVDITVCSSALASLAERKLQLAKQADIIIIVAQWKEWAAEDIVNTVGTLQKDSNAEIFVVGTKNFGKIDLEKYSDLKEAEIIALRNRPDDKSTAVNAILRAALPPAKFVDIEALTCPDLGCPIVTPIVAGRGGDLISWDGEHLTPAGAAWVGRILFTRSILSRFAGSSEI